MSSSRDTSLHNLNDCGCCEGTSGETPVEVNNRPGLSAIAYRAGTHAQFKQTMIARLSGSRLPSLSQLTTREENDFSIALIDSWATVADVLTFYQERIANENYLRTATERLSALELARLIGYKLRPGVAASTYLAFTLEDAPGALGQSLSLGTTAQIAPEMLPPITIDVGIKVQSIPAPGEQAQTFETVEKIEARPEWNALKPRLTEHHSVRSNTDKLLVKGLATGLKQGDGLLLFPDDGSQPIFRQVAKVTLEDRNDRTEVQLQPVIIPSARLATVDAPPAREARSVSAITSRFLNQIIDSADLTARSLIDGFDIKDIFANLIATKLPPPIIVALRTRASIFGHNAPKWEALPTIQRIGEFVSTPDPSGQDGRVSHFENGPYSNRRNSWAEQTLNNYHDELPNGTNVYLDNIYPVIVKDSWVVLKDSTDALAYKVTSTNEISKSDFTLSAKVSRLTLNTRTGFENFNIRETTVFGQSEELELARWPIESNVSGSQIELDGWVAGLSSGQNIIVCGELSTDLGVRMCEVATLDKVEHVLEKEGFTRITLSRNLANSYVRTTVGINANVALATHGETVEETLGSGDASQSFQRFMLRQPPLTYVSAANPSGAKSTLEVRVNDILWQEVSSFYGHGPDERIYVTEINDDDRTTVIFGDGKTGTRLPTGQENIRAKYRRGIGQAGQVEANRITLLMTHPLGLKGVTNPLEPAGAADSEKLSEVQHNAPITVLTLDCIVSLQDYEDFANAFSGIGKALATWKWFGERRGVLLTVAGAEGTKVKKGSTLYKNLLNAARASGDSTVPLEIKSYEPSFFRLSAAMKIDPRFLSEKVLAEVESKLRKAFSFHTRSFGQPVNLSEVISVIQSVQGIVLVDVNEFYRSDRAVGRNNRLEAMMPRAGDEELLAAELLVLDPQPLKLEVLQ